MRTLWWHQLVRGCLVTAATATSAAAHFDTGEELYQLCTLSEPMFRELGCGAMASAYLDMMRTLGYSCSTDGDTNRREVAEVLRKYLTDHPGDRRKDASALAVEAFTQAFQCSPPGHQ